ncbi:PilN domain-containing protein [Gracilimonas sediminicola]|uniref:PilN domain-containing protein n=1 Tax=Gracilimonas sediminicola TaxID=2952158 RepID=UPI0038D51479
MLSNKTYTGIVVDEEFLKVARIKITGKQVSLVSLDKVRLVESLKGKAKAAKEEETVDVFDSIDDSLDDEDVIFGLEEEEEDQTEELDLDAFEDDLDDLDFDDLDDLEGSDEIVDTDMVDETEAAASNELLLYNLLSSTDTKRVDVGLSIPAGQTIFQILKDVDFSETKKKDLQVIVDDRLEALHGVSKAEDYYSYSVRDDGALLLTSIDDEPDLLKLMNRTRDMYRGKLFINEILPDEILLLGLIRANYELEINSITGVVQFGEKTSRILFLKGSQLWIVSPIITEGIKNPKFLNTIFSKILFQLDTGEVPNLDRLIICNNSLGDDAIEFFEERFQDVNVSEFEFSDDFFDAEDINPSSIPAFTTAIGAAWSASGFKKDNFPSISFLPNYVIDRQKIFKLQWHGFLLLLLILLTPIVSNHFYTQNAVEIDRLRNEVSTLNSQIQSLEPTVQRYNQISSDLEQIQAKLVLLSELNQGTLRWSKNLDRINSGVDDVNSVWLTSATTLPNGDIELSGYAVYRERIAELADVFEDATLLNVTSDQIREQDVYSFTYVVSEFFEDESIYTPQSVQGIEELIQGN